MAGSVVAFVSIGGGARIEALCFSGIEKISEVPTYSVEILVSTTKLDGFLGKAASITFPEVSGSKGVQARSFSGVVTEASIVNDETNAMSDGSRVRLVMRPFLALLGFASYSAVYQQKSSTDILTDVLKRSGMSNMKVEKSGTPSKRDLCIQYNENDLDFVCRLLAEDGLVFYFSDGKDDARMIVHDVANSFPKNSKGNLKLVAESKADPNLFAAERLSLGRQVLSDKVTLATFDLERAAKSLSDSVSSRSTSVLEKPAVTQFVSTPSGPIKDAAKKRASQVRSAEETLTGETDHPAMYIGQELEIVGDRGDLTKGSYIVSGLTIQTTATGLRTRFTASPKGFAHQAPILSKPLISGVHNALVVGGADGEIVCDASGRVKVKFFWDMSAEKENTSPWIRVAETFAGNGYGGQFIPRVGHEVLVSFLHGDPDAPVITGQVYNGKNKHPNMTANTTKSGIMTKLKSKANELLFDDKDKAELLALRAAKDFELTVTENANRTINKDETDTVKGKAKRTVKETFDIDVTKDLTIDAEKITLMGKSKITLKVGSSSIELSSSGVKINANSITVEGSKVQVNGSAKVDIKGGQTSVAATADLSLKGLNVKAEGQVGATVKGNASVTVQASGMLSLKGGIVMIN